MAKKIAEIKPQEVVVMHHTGSVTGKAGAKAATKTQRDKIVETLAEATGLSVHPEDHEVIHP